MALGPKDFKSSEGASLASWKNVDLLSSRAYYEKSVKLLGSKGWVGSQPVFLKLWWQGN